MKKIEKLLELVRRLPDKADREWWSSTPWEEIEAKLCKIAIAAKDAERELVVVTRFSAADGRGDRGGPARRRLYPVGDAALHGGELSVMQERARMRQEFMRELDDLAGDEGGKP